ncbi:hypothetical protein [Ureibacillus manganicus]|uniref:Uncharacterized protein n=1 Tax=Ureibacillus manganicus DSM 26584 TaxID=1384049 RepID=A0A0A3I892_9BACL|nr:hypothetical protein [Ureibacillus manganicus]KGR78958.1 hypothetical protein CD29_07995 [Ureibacillus manganicus DSM 26584]
MSKIVKWINRMNDYYDNADATTLKLDLQAAGFNHEIVSQYYDEVACTIEDHSLIEIDNNEIAVKL